MTTSDKNTNLNRFTGKQKRAMNRAGNVLHVARKTLSSAKSYEDCVEWFTHKNRNVRAIAYAIAFKLPSKTSIVKSEFDLLVERFTAEGKKDPIKSARASLAASAKKRQNTIEAQQVNSL